VALSLAATRPDAKPTTPTPVCSAFMLGISGVWGGEDAFLTESGALFLRSVRLDPQTSRMHERRYKAQVSVAARSELAHLVERHRFMRLRNSKREWIPDEPLVLLGVSLCRNGSVALERSPRYHESRFAAVRWWFMEQIQAAESSTPIYDGVPDHGWRPEGMADVPEWHW
jgi:hypothetical protein